MTLNELLNEETLLEVKFPKGKKLEYHAFKEYKNDGRQKFKAGRERTVSAVIHRVESKGGSLSSQEARNYIYKIYNDWLSGNPAKWLKKLEKASIKNGYNPRKYASIAKGETSGLKDEQGRAYFFVGFLNGLANHFLKEQGLELFRPGEKYRVKNKRETHPILVDISPNGNGKIKG